MIIIGEKINTSRKSVAEAVKNRDGDFLSNLAKSQEEAGASYIDVNVGTFIKTEPEDMAWVVETISKDLNIPLSIDSPNPKVVESGLGVLNKPALINSISLEKKRFDGILPLVKEFECPVIALLIEDGNMPDDTASKMKIAHGLIGKLKNNGIDDNRIFVDPMVKPLSTSMAGLADILSFVKLFRAKYPRIHLLCGLSNVSFGLPNRGIINRAFLIMMMTLGVDAVICNPLDKELIGLVAAQEALAGNDEYCMNYINLSREGKI